MNYCVTLWRKGGGVSSYAAIDMKNEQEAEEEAIKYERQYYTEGHDLIRVEPFKKGITCMDVGRVDKEGRPIKMTLSPQSFSISPDSGLEERVQAIEEKLEILLQEKGSKA